MHIKDSDKASSKAQSAAVSPPDAKSAKLSSEAVHEHDEEQGLFGDAFVEEMQQLPATARLSHLPVVGLRRDAGGASRRASPPGTGAYRPATWCAPTSPTRSSTWWGRCCGRSSSAPASA